MATELNDSLHYVTFKGPGPMRTGNAFDLRPSEFSLSSLRAAGMLDRMVDGLTPPATDKLWLDKNSDPAVLKEWDGIGSAWMPMTFERLFERAPVTVLEVTGGTANAIAVSQPAVFISSRLYSVTPSLSNTGPVTVSVAGVGTFPIRYPGGGELDANEMLSDRPTLLIFRGNHFDLLFGYAALGVALEEIQGLTDEAKDARDEAVSAAASLNLPSISPSVAGGVPSVKPDGTGYNLVSPIISVATRTAMKALPVVGLIKTVNLVGESGRDGTFALKAGTPPISDPQEGIYVVSNTSGYYWERVYSGKLNVKWFGAKGDGVTNDTVAVQAANDILSAPKGGKILFPDGIWLIDNVTINGPISWEGTNRYSCQIKATTPTGFVVKASYQWISIRHMGFTSDVARTSGAYIETYGAFSSFEDLRFENAYGCIQVRGGVQPKIADIEAYHTTPSDVSGGSFVVQLGPEYSVCVVMSNIVADNPNGQPSYGILLLNCDSPKVLGCDIIRCGWDLAALPGNGQAVHALSVGNTKLDTAVRGLIMLPSGTGVVTRPSFSEVWTCSHTADGFYIDKCQGGAIVNAVRSNLNTSRGMLFGAGVDSLELTGCAMKENLADGVTFGAGQHGYNMTGCGATNNGGFGVSNSGSNDDYIICANRLTGNGSGGIYDSTTSPTRVVANNIG